MGGLTPEHLARGADHLNTPEMIARRGQTRRKSNAKRRAALAKLKSGEWSWPDFIAACRSDSDIARIRVREAVGCLPGANTPRVRNILAQVQWPDKVKPLDIYGKGERGKATYVKHREILDHLFTHTPQPR